MISSAWAQEGDSVYEGWEPPFEVPAREAILVDASTDTVLYAKNPDEQMPPASMSKLMTVYMVFDALKAGELKLTDTFPVSEKAWRKGGSKMFVKVRDRVAIEDLLRGVIVQSGNDASIVLAEGLGGSEEFFADMMNEKAQDIGLKNSNFENATGWPDSDHRMTARDLATLAEAIITTFPEYYGYYSEREFTYGVSLDGKPITQPNRNPVLGIVEGADGLKTGHTEAAGYGLTASAKRDDRRLVLVFNGMNSARERSRFAERFLEWGFRNFDAFKLLEAGQVVDEPRVWLGKAARVPLVVEEDLRLTLPRRTRDDMEARLVYEAPIPAPIKKGTPLGRLVLSAPDMEDKIIPLVAGADVEKVQMFGKIGSALEYLFLGASGQ
ncbi:MAG: D-alanyl-D-alanine carboxypeptidase family protein [Alphaproteobacteria bacterium]|nr:D-alanyl-D-alanine carboxypeptidase family protein [Alphaproteobacteria bacterium]